MADDNYLDENPDFPLVTPGTTVLIELRSTQYMDGLDGAWKHLNLEPAPMVVNYPDDCLNEDGHPHCETICTECISSWPIDWYICLPTTLADLPGSVKD